MLGGLSHRFLSCRIHHIRVLPEKWSMKREQVSQWENVCVHDGVCRVCIHAGEHVYACVYVCVEVDLGLSALTS